MIPLKKLIFIVITILGTGKYASCQEQDTSFLKIVFAGDIMGHDAQIEGAYDSLNNTYNYEPTFRYVKPYVESADVAIANLEVTLAGPPYKGYPQFSSPDVLALEAKKAGFDILADANNHALDRGSSGFSRTIKVLDSLKIIHTGTFDNKQERGLNYPLIFEKNNIRIALLNCTYGTNGLTIPSPYIIDRIDTSQIKKDIKKAQLADPDYVIIFIHWGIEYERTENSQQQKLAAFFLNNGADAVIGSHPHVIQPIRKYFRQPGDSTDYNLVVYSLGNFVSNQRAQYKDGGIIFEMDLMKTRGKTSVKNYSYLPSWVYREDNDNNKSTFFILPVQLYLNNRDYFNFPDYISYRIDRFYEDTKSHLSGIPENSFYNNYTLPDKKTDN